MAYNKSNVGDRVIIARCLDVVFDFIARSHLDELFSFPQKYFIWNYGEYLKRLYYQSIPSNVLDISFPTLN